MHRRFEELDLLRGIGVILMIIFHFAFDLDFFKIAQIDTHRGLWLAMARIIQFIFIGTTGITLAITAERDGVKKEWYRRRCTQALKLFVLALVITLITKLLTGDLTITFGILHFYGAAIILALPLMKLKIWNALIGAWIFVVSPSITLLQSDNPLLIPLGITRPDYTALDYFPLLPWFGLFLIGVAAGGYLYKNNMRRFDVSFGLPNPLKIFLKSVGRKSLILYLIHQPILLGILWFYVTFS